MAKALVQLGFNLDFFPTLDVNLNRHNPIIGVRSFGDTPETVWHLGKIAMQAFQHAGLIAVGKHFPGHGNGTVDSHLDLPTLHFTPEELQPFQQAIQAGLPVMLVAHGFYPALQTTEAERNLPSSASPTIIQGLLREQCGFQGVIITDDMCMGAITKHRSPVEAAIAALKAGVDILLYKQSTADEWAVYNAVLEAFQCGALPLAQLHQSLERILALKHAYLERPKPCFQREVFTPTACQAQAEAIAHQGITILYGQPDGLPVPPHAKVLLVHPDRESMGNYAFDVPTSPPLDQLMRQTGFTQVESHTYPPRSAFDPSHIIKPPAASPDVVVLVTFNPMVYPSQAALYQALQQQFPAAPIILVSAGTPDDRDVMPNPALHLSLCSYRPASMQALADCLTNGLGNSPATPPQEAIR
jgi:beta-N-acetylhexosaminidase